MTFVGWSQIAIVLALVLAAAIPLSGLIANVYAGEAQFPHAGRCGRSSAASTALAGVDETREQSWLVYAMAMIAFSIAGFVSLYALQRLQNHLPLNPQGFDARAGRPRVQHLDQLHHQHQLAELRRRDDDESSHPDARPHRPQFPLRGDRPRHGLRAGARLRALVRDDGRQFLGRCDAHRALRAAAALDRRRAASWSRSACRRRSPARSTSTTLEGAKQTISIGPMASQEAIKELGTNGGGFMNANSAHPFENPNAWTNMLEIWSLLLIPVASVHRLRPRRRRLPPGPGDPRRDGRSCSSSASASSTGPRAPAIRCSPRSASIPPAAISKARKCASARR